MVGGGALERSRCRPWEGGACSRPATPISSICRRAISARRALICWLVLSWFTTTLFLIFAGPVGVFERVERLHEVAGPRAHAGDHDGLAGECGVWNEGRAHSRTGGITSEQILLLAGGALRTWAEPGAGAPHHLAWVSLPTVLTCEGGQ